jgi:polyphosphate kinase
MSQENSEAEPKSWLQLAIEDDLDEELEQEIDDTRFPPELRTLLQQRQKSTIDRRLYFNELLRLQGELVKLQDWLQHHRKKVVVVFEGRDSAGKGGVIKRIMQRMNPRVCRVVALPAPSDREKTQWLIAAGTIVPALSVSWASPALTRLRNSSAMYRSLSACWCVQVSF